MNLDKQTLGGAGGQHNTVWKLVPAVDNTMMKQVSISTINSTANS